MSVSHMPGPLQELEHPVDELKPDPRNPREHPQEQVEAIAESMAEFGQDQPIVARKSDGLIIKGEGRWRAAKMLGWETVSVVTVDEDDTAALRRNLADHGTQRASYLDQRVLWQLLEQTRETEGGGPVPGFGDEFMDSLRMAQETEPDEEDEVPGEPEDWQERGREMADEFRGAVIKQVVLIYEDETYDELLDELGWWREQTDAENNTEAAMKLLSWWESYRGLTGEGAA